MSEANRPVQLQPQAPAPVATRKAAMQQIVDKIMPNLTKLKTVSPERFAQIFLVEVGRNPKLAECTSETLCASLMLSAELGLEPSGPRGHAYLIPRNTTIKGSSPPRKEMQCTLMIGYKGYAELARRSGEVVRINAQPVYQGEVDRGLWTASLEPAEITHEYALDIDRSDSELVAAYAVAEMKDGSRAQAILSYRQIEAHRARGDNGPAWTSDYAKMARKTALRELLAGGLVPIGAAVERALDKDADAPAIETTATVSIKHEQIEQPIEPAALLPEPPPLSDVVQELGSQIDTYLEHHNGVWPQAVVDAGCGSYSALTRLDDATASRLLDVLANLADEPPGEDRQGGLRL